MKNFTEDAGFQVSYAKLAIAGLLFLIPLVGLMTLVPGPVDLSYVLFACFGLIPAVLFFAVKSDRGVLVFGIALVVLVALSWLAFATATPTEFQALPYFLINIFTILVAGVCLALDSGWRSDD
jgi:hypothetical protein